MENGRAGRDVPTVKLSKGFYVGSFVLVPIARILLFFVFIGFLTYLISTVSFFEGDIIPILLGTLSFTVILIFAWIYLLIVETIFLYRMWEAIDDGNSDIPPLLAAVLNIIPFIGTFWNIIVFPWFVHNYNGYLKRHSPGSQGVSPVISYIYSVLFLVAVMTGFGLDFYASSMIDITDIRNLGDIAHIIENLDTLALLSLFLMNKFIYLASLIVFIIIVWKICDMVNTIPDLVSRDKE